MSDDSQQNSIVKDTAGAVKGILEVTPIYQDAIQPAARQVGETLETVGRAVNAVLVPLNLGVWWVERFKNSMRERLKYVPPERIIAPNPAVVGPVLQALPWVGHQEELREMFANLIAASMDSATAHHEHPSF